MREPTLGLEPSKNEERKSPRVVISMPRQFLDTVRKYSKKRQIPMSVIARVAIAEYMERNGGVKYED